MYPMHDMIRGKVFKASPPDPHLFAHPPTLRLVSRVSRSSEASEQSTEGSCKAGETERLKLVLQLPQPGVGVLNVTGSIQGWSLSDPLPQSSTKV